MGWGLNINNLYLSRVTRNDLQSTLESNKAYMKSMSDELIALSASNNTIYDDGDQKWPIIEWVIKRVPEILADYEELSWKNFLIEHAIEYPEDVTGDETY